MYFVIYLLRRGVTTVDLAKRVTLLSLILDVKMMTFVLLVNMTVMHKLHVFMWDLVSLDVR